MDCERGGSRSTLLFPSIRSGNHLSEALSFGMELLDSQARGFMTNKNIDKWHIASDGVVSDVWMPGGDLMAFTTQRKACMMTKELMAFSASVGMK